MHNISGQLARNLTRAVTAAVTSAVVLTSAILIGPHPATAQNLFAPVAQVNDSVVTAYELSQRMAFLTLLRAPGDVREVAMQQLVQERLQLAVAKEMGIELTPEKLTEGMAEFAARANLETDKFIEAIAQAGVAAESFRDFVSNGMLWREVVRARFRSQVRITESEIDHAVTQAEPDDTGTRVLLSEIVLPANSAQSRAASTQRAAQLSNIDDFAAFASAAQRYSVAPSKGQRGELDWRNLADLPAAVAGQVRGLSPGQVTRPITVRNGIALFQMREIDRGNGPAVQSVHLEYARYFIPGGRGPAGLDTAAKTLAQIDTCDDLYTVARDQPAEMLLRDTLPIAEVPTDIALALSGLDIGEVSLDMTTNNGETLVFLMLCNRTRVLAETVSRDAMRIQLSNQRLVGLADGFLQELRADAFIEIYD